jgi:hypothetical protein
MAAKRGFALILPQQLRQLRDIRRNPPRLTAQGAGNEVWALGFSARVT